MKSPIMKILGMAAWLITGLAAINTGLVPFGYDFFSHPMITSQMDALPEYLQYVVGIAGIVSLCMMGCMLIHGKSCCGSCRSSAQGCAKCGSMGNCNCR
jgi:uncharacterized membrane protein YuzA (DUF378 family)